MSREADDTKQFVVGQLACFFSSRHLMSTASTLSLSLALFQWSARNEQHTREKVLISAWAQVRVDRSASLLDWRCPHVIACRPGEHIQQDNSASFINVRWLFPRKKSVEQGVSDDVWTREREYLYLTAHFFSPSCATDFLSPRWNFNYLPERFPSRSISTIMQRHRDQISIHLRARVDISHRSMLTFHIALILLYRWCDHS